MRKTAGAVRQNARHIAILSIIGALLVVATAATADTRAPVRIMPCGDSITYDNHSGDTRPDSLRTGYRQPLWLLLEGAGYDVDFVGKVRAGYGAVPHFDSDSEGHPGWQDHQVADSIYVWLEQNPADIILLHIGTNGLNTDGR